MNRTNPMLCMEDSLELILLFLRNQHLFRPITSVSANKGVAHVKQRYSGWSKNGKLLKIYTLFVKLQYTTDIVSSVDSFSSLKGAPVFPAVLVYLSRMALKHCTPDKGGCQEASDSLRGCGVFAIWLLRRQNKESLWQLWSFDRRKSLNIP